jgi:hypothetical protein
MSDRSRVTVYLDSDLAADIKEIALVESRSVANYLERVLLGSEELDGDLRSLKYRREQEAKA